MMDVAPTVSVALGLPVPADAKGSPIAEIVADLEGMERVAVLAPDAFGWFAWTLWRDEMPFLQLLHTERSVILRSVLPSITPVNFTAMITGTITGTATIIPMAAKRPLRSARRSWPTTMSTRR